MNDTPATNPADDDSPEDDRPATVDRGTPVGGPGWYAASPVAPGAPFAGAARMLPPSGVLPEQARAGRFTHPLPRRRLGVVAGGALGLGILLGGVGVGSYSLGTGSRAAAVIPAAGVTTTTTALSTSKTAVAALVSSVSPAVVDIHATGSGTSSSGSGLDPYAGSTASADAGTGMIVSADGYIVTNAHVIDGSSSITVTLHGQTSKRAATVVGIDRTDDIAVIKISATGLPTVTFGSSAAVAVGDPVITLGNALDLVQGDISVSTGIISGLNRTISTDESTSMKGLLQTDAAISSGDSGGALVNAAGQVVGMNTAAAASASGNEAENIGFAIPSSRLVTVIRAAEAGKYPTDASTGAGAASGSGSGSTGSAGGYGNSGGYGSSGGWGGFSN